MTDTHGEKLDTIIKTLGQLQRTLGHLASDVQLIRDRIGATAPEKTSPLPPPEPLKRP
jgi:hypothetical protein